MVLRHELRLARREPWAGEELLAVLRARAVPGLERLGPDGRYVRTLALPGGPAVAALHLAGPGAVTGVLTRAGAATGGRRGGGPAGAGDEAAAVGRLRALLDLDADPAAVDAHLAADPVLAPLVRARPGLRVLGTVDPFELALRAVIGQQVSVAAARTVLGRIVLAHGPSLPPGLDPDPAGEPLRLLPSPAAMADLPDDALPMPRARAATVRRLAAAVADGVVDLRPHEDPATADEARAGTVRALLALPGIGPWTASYVAMRGLGDRDAFPAGDLVLRRSAGALGLPSDARGLAARAERWAPFRAYAAGHLWAAAADGPAA